MQSEVGEFHHTFLVYPRTILFLDASADIDIQGGQSEQGTVSVETTFCNQDKHTFLVYLCTILGFWIHLLILTPKYSKANKEP